MKKAFAITELMIMLLVIAGGIGLLFLTKEGAQKAGCMTDVELCRESYVFFSKLKEKLPVGSKIDCPAISPPNCKEKELKVEGTPEEKKQKTMFIIAENLRWCWHKTLGIENKMGEDWAKVFGVYARDVDLCLPCSEFIPTVDISAADWDKYLQTQKIHGTEQTYAQFVNPPDTVWNKDFWHHGFEKDKRYYVVSVSAERTKDDNKGRIYIDTDVYCGPSNDRQIPYQRKA